MSPPLAGPVPTLWDSDGPEAAWVEAEELLARAAPPAVQLHTWRPELVAGRVRAALPGVELVCGFGVDSVARNVALGRWTVRQGVRQFVALAVRATDCRARAVCWNAEGGWKRPPSSDEAARLEAVVAEGLATVARDLPTLRQWHTSYDHPSYHSAYNWRAWLGAESPVEESFFQVYAAPGGQAMAHRGALPRREARALASFGAAVRAGWFSADDPATALREGVQWGAYYQLHHVTTADTVAAAVEKPRVCLWAVRSRTDEDGRRALLALCELYRRGFWGPGMLQRFQASAGLAPDNVCGPLTLAALGVA